MGGNIGYFCVAMKKGREVFGMKVEAFRSKANQIDQGTFRFDCHPGVECFTVCCSEERGSRVRFHAQTREEHGPTSLE